MRILILILTILSLSKGLYAQGIKGRVINEKRESIVGATITIYQNDLLQDQTTSGNAGIFYINFLKPGHYDLITSYKGFYQNQTIRVPISDSNLTLIRIHLQPKTDTSSKIIISSYKNPFYYDLMYEPDNKISSVWFLGQILEYYFDMDNPSKRTYDRDEINRMPY